MGHYYETFNPPFFMRRRASFDVLAVNAKAYDRNDHEICADLMRRFKKIGAIDTSKVQITCSHQVVTLQGSVANPLVRKFLEKVAENILGARGTVNNLEVHQAGASAQPSPLSQSTKYPEPGSPSIIHSDAQEFTPS